MTEYENFHHLPAAGKKIDLSADVFVVNRDLSLSKYTLQAFIDEHKDYVPTPDGIQPQYYTEGNDLKQWMFSQSFLIHRYKSAENAELALKVFNLKSVERETAPLFFYSEKDAKKAILELSAEDATI